MGLIGAWLESAMLDARLVLLVVARACGTGPFDDGGVGTLGMKTVQPTKILNQTKGRRPSSEKMTKMKP